MANAGVSQEIRQKLAGHVSAEVNRHYTHHELEPLRAAGERDQRAWAEWLKLAFPAGYRVSGNKIEVNASASVSPIVMTEERRMVLIERRKRLLAQRGTDAHGTAV